MSTPSWVVAHGRVPKDGRMPKRGVMAGLRRRVRVMHACIALLIFGQGAVLSPLFASELMGRAMTIGGWTAQAAQAVQRRLPNRPVRVNRTVPRVSAPNLSVVFNDIPTTDELMRARVFTEPLVPIGGAPSDADNTALGRTLEGYAGARTESERLTVLQDYLAAAQASPWRASIALNLGSSLWQAGYFSRAARFWAEAWELAKDATVRTEKAVADIAIAELMTHQMTFGQVSALEARAREIEGRAIGGTAGNKVQTALEGLGTLVFHHENAVFSGPVALISLMDRVGTPNADSRRTITSYHPSHLGTTLQQLLDLGSRAGMRLQMRHVTSLQEVHVPSIVHFKSEHFSTIIEREADGYLVRDPALGGIKSMSAAALQDEMSGYVLVPNDAGTVGRAVEASEAQLVVGHCHPGSPGGDEPCGCEGGDGMPVPTLHPMNASVVLNDTPLSYAPPVGPAVSFHLRYTQRTGRLPQVPTSGNVGPLWSHDWMSWVVDNVTYSGVPNYWASVVVRGETKEDYNTWDGPTHWRRRATLVKVSHDPPRYERTLPDGTKEVFTVPDRGPSLSARQVFLSEIVDPQGHALTFTYDSQVRLVAVTDAIGQVTTLEYSNPADPLLLTKVTDPFGRTALLTYDALGRVDTLTDAAGLASRVTYAPDDFVQALTTPYGTTSFRRASEITMSSNFRRIEMTDPEGGTERVEYHMDSMPGLSASLPSGDVPTGFSDLNNGLDKYNSLHWDKRAMAEAPGDVSRATLTHWLFRDPMAYSLPAWAVTRSIPHSVKRPLETRMWYRYPNQSGYQTAGTGTQPLEVARLLDGGVTQKSLATYNSLGMVTSRTDPMGRQTTYTYAANGIDLLEVRQVNGGSTDLLATFANYTTLHQPGTFTDAAGQTTTTTYNAAGQPLTVTNAKGEITTYTYASTTGYLQTVTGPVSGSTTTYNYDAHGRVDEVTEAGGHAVTMEYDALNRLTKRTYPDGTYEQTTYQRLDVATERDRKGRITRHFYDGLGRRTSTRDPLGRVISQVWCACGALDALIDANGNKTTWERDVQNRVVREVRADGTTDTHYTYDATGRLKTVTDPKDQVTTHVYGLDDSLTSTTYANAVIATPGVSYTYDSIYPRVLTMVDGIGTTAYAYKAPGTLGAGQVASVNGPLANDTITYTYDQLGRVAERAINGSANTVTWTFDALGRVTNEVNLLGTFTYTYDGVTSRLATVSYPNGQTSAYSYLPTNQDHRLQTIHHKYPGGATLSKFDYTYDAVGNILTWRQQADTSAVLWRYGYDSADQLTSAIKESTATPAAILSRYAYGYDPAGNRLFEQIDDQVTAASHDNLNRLLSHTPGGPLQFVGTVNEPATVMIDSRPAVVDSTNTFRGPAPTAAGTTTVTVTATDPSGNVATQQYEVDVTGTPKTFTYDANGNMTSDGTTTYHWNARDELVRVVSSEREVLYSWGGAKKLWKVTETEFTSGPSTETGLIWCGIELCGYHESGDQGSLYTSGEYRQGNAISFALDHLGTPRVSTDGNGTTIATVDTDPFGRRTGTPIGGPSRAFGAMAVLSEDSNILHTTNRFYSPSLARWLSQDPAGLADGANMTLYVRNNPLRYVDPTGLATTCTPWTATGVTPWRTKSRTKRPLTNWAFAAAIDTGDFPGVAGVLAGQVACRWERITDVTEYQYQFQFLSRMCVESSDCKPSRFWWEYNVIEAERTISNTMRETTLTFLTVPAFLKIDGVMELMCMEKGRPPR